MNMINAEISDNAGDALLVASSGGHLQELLRLKKIVYGHAQLLVTEKTHIKSGLIGIPTSYVWQTNRRELLFPIKFVLLCVYSTGLLVRYRPRYIITTGALISVPFCIIGKLMGKKIIYIETFARIHSLSLSGKIVYPMADRFIVQWKELEVKYPKAYYGGINDDFSVTGNPEVSDEQTSKAGR